MSKIVYYKEWDIMDEKDVFLQDIDSISEDFNSGILREGEELEIVAYIDGDSVPEWLKKFKGTEEVEVIDGEWVVGMKLLITDLVIQNQEFGEFEINNLIIKAQGPNGINTEIDFLNEVNRLPEGSAISVFSKDFKVMREGKFSKLNGYGYWGEGFFNFSE